MLLDRGDLLAPILRLGLDDPDRFLVDEENVVGRADIRLILTDGDAEAGAEVDFLLVLNDPPRLGQHLRRSCPGRPVRGFGWRSAFRTSTMPRVRRTLERHPQSNRGGSRMGSLVGSSNSSPPRRCEPRTDSLRKIGRAVPSLQALHRGSTVLLPLGNAHSWPPVPAAESLPRRPNSGS